MKTTIVIPARYGSTRFPGKPLELVSGISMLERVWRIARSNRHGAHVLIATDDERICRHVTGFGGDVTMTPTTCRNGTERVFEAIRATGLRSDAYINLQGDALLTPPWVLDAVISELMRDPSAEIVTPAVALGEKDLESFARHKTKNPSSGTTVVFGLHRNALYFSKALIPFRRNDNATATYRHIGLYGFQKESLARFISLPPSPLELAEGLEQLRALENGMNVRIVVVDYAGRRHGSVDSPQDIPIVEAIIAQDGELFD